MEQEKVDHLASIIQVSPELARKALRKHKGDLEKAADALLAGYTGMEENTVVWDKQRRNTPEPSSSNAVTLHVPSASNNTSVPSNNVIDLTGDDDMTRALQMSIEDSSLSGDRAPKPDWQTVPTYNNVMCFWFLGALCNSQYSDCCLQDQTTSDAVITTEDKSLSDAIQASLASIQDSEMDTSPIAPALREGGRYVTLLLISNLAKLTLVQDLLLYAPSHLA